MGAGVKQIRIRPEEWRWQCCGGGEAAAAAEEEQQEDAAACLFLSSFSPLSKGRTSQHLGEGRALLVAWAVVLSSQTINQAPKWSSPPPPPPPS